MHVNGSVSAAGLFMPAQDALSILWLLLFDTGRMNDWNFGVCPICGCAAEYVLWHCLRFVISFVFWKPEKKPRMQIEKSSPQCWTWWWFYSFFSGVTRYFKLAWNNVKPLEFLHGKKNGADVTCGSCWLPPAVRGGDLLVEHCLRGWYCHLQGIHSEEGKQEATDIRERLVCAETDTTMWR